MVLKGIATGALFVIGAGILAERFGAGTGLSSLGAGISSIVGAPGVGFGAGLSGTAMGIRDIAESFGDIGRGFGAIFEAIPEEGFNIPGGGLGPPDYGDTENQNMGAAGGGVYAVGSAWTFAGAGKLFKKQEKAELRYKEFMAGGAGSNV